MAGTENKLDCCRARTNPDGANQHSVSPPKIWANRVLQHESGAAGLNVWAEGDCMQMWRPTQSCASHENMGMASYSCCVML